MHLLLKATVPIGLAPGGVYPATAVTSGAVRSYRTLSPLPDKSGGLLSVALSLRSPSLAVNQHRISVEPGLSSPAYRKPDLRRRPSSRLPGRNQPFAHDRVKAIVMGFSGSWELQHILHPLPRGGRQQAHKD